jgi:hypothetical protein
MVGVSRRVQLGLAAAIAVLLGAGIATAVVRAGREEAPRAAGPATTTTAAAPATTTTVPATTVPATTTSAPVTTTTAPATTTSGPPSGLATGGAGEVAAGPRTPATGIESALLPGLALVGVGLALRRARGQRSS